MGLLQPLSADWKWENVSMDFITGLSRTLKGYTVIWVVVNRLTKSAHFISRISTHIASKWAKLYLTKIVGLHGVSISIVSNRDARFTSKFWKRLQVSMGMRSPVCWDDIGEQRLMVPELVQSTNEGDKVFLKVAPMKGVFCDSKRRGS
ncbi:pol protein [Cucumis melo var. makuwa]|uniref:Pol protein n=1 Tax=Cucumis melo var. makuwa TaxID=1194695 RepID=A0A5D3DST6_CUCMM|nr:pol protein [Cucumis melo var. makuwa]TYK26776.1 pol protein [Cucumis melo var. makuwa]